MKPSAAAIFAITLVAIGSLAVGIGFAVIGTPERNRIRRLDEQRVLELRSLTDAITQYRNRHHRLPDSLDEVAKSGLMLSVHNGPYEYRRVGDTTFQLCADFEGSSNAYPAAGSQLDPWMHGQGRVCFNR